MGSPLVSAKVNGRPGRARHECSCDAVRSLHARSFSEQPQRCRCGFVSDHVSGRTAAVLVTVGVVHALPQSRRADTDVLDAHVDLYAGDAHTRASGAHGKAEPPGISAVPRADIYVVDDVHHPNRRPRPKCSVHTAYCNFEFAGGIDKSELLKCPAHVSGAYASRLGDSDVEPELRTGRLPGWARRG